MNASSGTSWRLCPGRADRQPSDFRPANSLVNPKSIRFSCYDSNNLDGY